MRELTKYLYATGHCDGIFSMDSVPRTSRYTPYIFTDTELLVLFEQSDKTDQVDPRNPLAKDIIAVILNADTFIHEIGHALGLSHRITNTESIMCSPVWGRTASDIQNCDLTVYHHLYG